MKYPIQDYIKIWKKQFNVEVSQDYIINYEYARLIENYSFYFFNVYGNNILRKKKFTVAKS